VADDAEEIREAVEDGLRRAELVVVTGGLGPTEDDLTLPAVAELFGAPLEEREEILERLRARFQAAGYDELPRRNVAQARVPRGGRVLENPHGTAPGIVFTPEAGVVALLPGVPREMKAMVRGDLVDVLKEEMGERFRPVHHRMIHTTGIAESELAGLLEEALPSDSSPVKVAFLPDVRGVDLRLTARGVGPERAARELDRMEAELEPVVGSYRFEAESGDVVEAVSRELRRRGVRLGAAESCTGGLLAKRMTDRPGSSEVFAGGVVAYADEVKSSVLGVDPEAIRDHGAVSEVVAEALAEGIAKRLGTEAGVGITGIAGPGGGTEEKPVGLVCFAARVGNQVNVRRRTFPGDRDDVRERSVQATLALLLRLLEDRGGEG
jgi:nicotinamide-nucleotide amidase